MSKCIGMFGCPVSQSQYFLSVMSFGTSFITDGEMSIIYVIIGIIAATMFVGPMISAEMQEMRKALSSIGMYVCIWILVVVIWPVLLGSLILLGVIWLIGAIFKVIFEQVVK